MSENEYIKNIINANNDYDIKVYVKKYVDNEYDILKLSNLSISDTKKKALYESIIRYFFYDLFYYEIKKEKDKILFLKVFCIVNPEFTTNYYPMLSDITDPVSVFSVDELKTITKFVSINDWESVEDSIGFKKTADIINVIIPINNVFQATKVLKYIPVDKMNTVYEAACQDSICFKHYYNNVDNEEKEKLLDYYLINKKNDYYTSIYILQNNLVKDDISLIEKSSSTIIYLYIMNNDLNNEDEKKLEKALLKTNDFEYIIYYYFYKNKYMFYKIFINTVIFLAFVKMNEVLFKNRMILDDVIDKIKNEMDWFNKYVDDAYKYEYEKKLK